MPTLDWLVFAALKYNFSINFIQVSELKLVQAACIAGFSIQSLGSVLGATADCKTGWVFLYWIGSAISVVGAMHVLLCTTFITVYGEGMAIRGPPGSMAKAVEGMKFEQQQIVIVFNISFFAYGLSNIGMYWIMMGRFWAMISSIITVIGMFYWYSSCIRIYNRFGYNIYERCKGDDNVEDDHDFDVNDDDTPITPQRSVSSSSSRQLNHKLFRPLFKDQGMGSTLVTTGKTWLRYDRGRCDHASTDTESNTLTASLTADILRCAYDIHVDDHLASDHNRASSVTITMHHGYITIQLPKTRRLFSLETFEWRRVYVVINDNKLFYYNDRKSYEEDPQNSCLRKRPVLLENYFLNMDSVEPPYQLSLTPHAHKLVEDVVSNKKQIRFRCDTTAEVAMWVDIFRAALTLAHSRDVLFMSAKSHGD